MARALSLLRSLLFLLWMVVTVVPIALTVLLASIVQRGASLYWMCIGWLRLVIWGARWICGLASLTHIRQFADRLVGSQLLGGLTGGDGPAGGAIVIQGLG